MLGRIWRTVLGRRRDPTDPSVFHQVSLVAFLAWVGLGADGLSSSAYGPDEAYRALGGHARLSVFLVLMTAVTITVISIAYSNLIEHFPGGGGGYLVATKLLGEKAGVVSGSALLVDYVLTITTSIAASCDQMWSFLPAGLAHYKLPAEIAILALLIVLNLRGVKESVTILAPIFVVFVVGHAAALLYVIASHAGELPAVVGGSVREFHDSVRMLGFWPVVFVLLRAYSMGGGTYTGIEAVSNGVTMLREPRVKTGKRTMFLMATSLALTAGGILFGYLLVGARAQAGKTMNFVLFDAILGGFRPGGLPVGSVLVMALLVSEATLLFVAAQAGFLDGPRILSNMALDSWVPHRFSNLSSRLVTRDGVVLMGGAAVVALLYTRGNITTLIVMYSINVFITFSLTELGMARHWIVDRHKEPRWKSQLAIHGTGLVLCLTILGVTLYEKFTEGGWVTSVVTGALIALCFLIRRHYRSVKNDLKRLDAILGPAASKEPRPEGSGEMDRSAPTAILTVDRFSGYGLHQVLTLHRLFPRYYKNLVFVSVGVVDTGNFKGAAEIGRLEDETRSDLEKYVGWARGHGWNATSRMAIDQEAVPRLAELCREVREEFPRAVVFSGKLIFSKPRWTDRLLHNETAEALQRRLHLDGIPSAILAVRVLV